MTTSRARWPLPTGLLVLHLALAWFYQFVQGVRITADPERDTWNWFWQTLPMDLLRTDLVRSLWNLHAQPPLHNLLGGLLGKFCHPHHLEVQHHIQIVLGGLLTVMVFRIAEQLTQSRWTAAAIGLLVAVSPGLLLFEAYILYTLLATFLVVATTYCLATYERTARLRHLMLFVLCLNLLMLTRTVFHVALLAAVLPLVAIIARDRWRQALGIGALICLMSVGWYAKNAVKFGFFGATSWTGQNLWKIATSNVSAENATAILGAVELDPAATRVRVFSLPHAYREYGFREASDLPALSRNDHNNINIVAISRMYGENARRLIAHDPLHYLRTAGYSYGVFCRPASEYEYLHINRARMHTHEALYSDWILGRAPANWLGRFTFFAPGSLLFFLIPATLLGHAISFIRRTRLRPAHVLETLRAEPTLTFLAFVTAFATTVSCFFDYEENMRFRFVIEPLLFVYFGALACRWWRRRKPPA